MFPGAGAQIYRNEAGEPTGWDYPAYDEGPNFDDFDDYDYDEDPDDAESEDAVCDRCGEEFTPEQVPQAAEHVKTCTAEPLYGDEHPAPQDTADRWDNPDTNDGIEFADERDNT